MKRKDRRHAQEVQKVSIDMNEKAKAAKRAYMREWNRRNPDKVRASQERYWNKRAAEIEAATGGTPVGKVKS